MTTHRINAEQARDIARAHDPSFAIDEILAGVEACAREGKYEYTTRKFGFGDSACYGFEKGYPEQCKAILRELRALGFNASVKAEEKQFVDLWLSVTWDS